MATNRILEFTPSQEEAIVARILVLLHQAVDEHFPSAEKATRQFTKTVFSEDGSERTAIGSLPSEGGFGNEEKTGPGERPPDVLPGVHVPPPPPRDLVGASAVISTQPVGRVPSPPSNQPSAKPSQTPVSRVPPETAATASMGPASSSASAITGMSGMSDFKKRDRADGPDWVTRAMLALLIAGLIVLAYSFLA